MLLIFLVIVFTSISTFKRRKALHELNPLKEPAGLFEKMLSDSSLYLKRCRIAFTCLLIFSTSIFFLIVGGLHNASSYISGLAGTIGAIRLELSISSYIEITDNPTRLLVIQNGDLNPDLSVYFDGDYLNCSKGGWGIRNGTGYFTSIRPFTQRYAVVTLSPANVPSSLAERIDIQNLLALSYDELVELFGEPIKEVDTMYLQVYFDNGLIVTVGVSIFVDFAQASNFQSFHFNGIDGTFVYDDIVYLFGEPYSIREEVRSNAVKSYAYEIQKASESDWSPFVRFYFDIDDNIVAIQFFIPV